MRVLVTGATGLLGANLVRHALPRAAAVRVLLRSTSNTLGIDGLDIERHAGDLADRQALRRACDGIDVVFHAAALVSMWAGHRRAMHRTNVEGTTNVIAACRDAGVRRLVHVSTVDTIGFDTTDGFGATPDKPSNENTAWANDRFDMPYAHTKRQAEQRVMQAIETGLDAVIVNPGFMLGAWDVKPSSGAMVLAGGKGLLRAAPPGGNCFVDVADVCAGAWLAAERGRRGRRYILGHENLTYRQVFERIATITGAPRPWLTMPRPVAMAVGAAGSVWGVITRSAPQTNRRSMRVACAGHYMDNRRSREELGVSYHGIEGAIGAAWRWFCEHGYAKANG